MAPALLNVVASLLVLAGVKAEEIDDRSSYRGFLSKYKLFGADASKTSTGDYDKFVASNLKRMKHGGGPDASSYHNVPTGHSQHLDSKEKTVQKMVGNDSNMSISLSAVAVAFLSLTAMLGVRMRRWLQPASIVDSSGTFGSEMSVALAQASGDDISTPSDDFRRAGWGQMSSESSSPLTVCHATTTREKTLDISSGSVSVSDMSAQMADVRAQLESDEKASMVMQALRGTNTNQNDFQDADVKMKVVEMRAGEQGLPTEYQPDELGDYFKERPGAVASRVAQVASTSFGFLGGLAWDAARGKLEEAEVERAAQLRKTIVSLGPFFIKLGQALSIRPDILSPRAMVEMQQLCDKVPSFPSEIAFATICSELGINSVDEVFSEITPEPVAAASLGQVYKATLRDSGDIVAVKVQRPYVLETVSLDLYLARTLGELLRKFGPPALVERVDVVALIDEFAQRFYSELDYVVECENGIRVAEDMKDLPRVLIPANYPQWTTRRVHVAEWVDGEKLSQSTADDVADLVNLGVVTYLTQLLETGFFHADPHPGNMLRARDGRLVILDFGLMTEVTDDQRFGMIEAIAHLIHRDYERIGEDFVNLDFIPEGTDVKPIVPALARVFDAALAGGGAKGINFNDLAADLAEITFKYPFRIPPYFALVIRAIGVLEGIALVGDPGFAIVDEAYPYISRRLMTDTSPRLRAALRYMVYGQGQRFDVERVIDMLQALERFTAVKKLASPGMIDHDADDVVLKNNALPAPAGLVRLEGDVPASRRNEEETIDADAARDALTFFFDADGAVFREFLLDELAASIDAGARSAIPTPSIPLASPRVMSALNKLRPGLTDDDRQSIENARKLADFLLRRDAYAGNSDLSSVAPSGASARVIRQLRALTPIVTERQADLREFGTRLAARLAEKQVARTFSALADIVGPQPKTA
jgi:aarF domain-containing kinase